MTGGIMFKIKALVILLVTLFATQVFADSTASYNSQTGALHIPKVKVEGDYSGTSYRVDMIDNDGLNFSISGVAGYTDSSRALTGLKIDGGSLMIEGESLQLSALALWSDGTWSDVTSMAAWSESSSVVNSVTKGLVRAGSVSSDRSAGISASYSNGGQLESDSHAVEITQTFVSSAHFEIIDLDEPLYSPTPLRNNIYSGIYFTLSGNPYDNFYVIASEDFLYAETYEEMVAAIEKEIVSQINNQVDGFEELQDIFVYLGEEFSVYNHSGELLTGRTVVLEARGKELKNLEFMIGMDDTDDANVYKQAYTSFE
jgi:hypothetical protein